MVRSRDMPRPRRKYIRLSPDAYAQPGTICSVTIAVAERRPIFASQSAAIAAVQVIQEHARRTSVSIYACCVMPDHVHFVLSPSSTCDVITFVGQFKNLTQRALWQQGVNGTFWQKSFWDHFLRADESLDHVVHYVLNNPVRGGLVEEPSEYPFSGSLVFDLPKSDQLL